MPRPDDGLQYLTESVTPWAGQLHETVQGHLRDLEQAEIDKAVEKVKAAKARYFALLAQE